MASNLFVGEIAINNNIAEPSLFIKNSTGGVTQFVDKQYIDTKLDNKVNKENGKSLTTNDYTTADKNKLATIAEGAEVNVQSDWNATSGDALILNKPTIPTVPPMSIITMTVTFTDQSVGVYNVYIQP